jgi:hypothetical protein
VQKESIIEYPDLKKHEIEDIVREANRQFFFEPRFILANLFRFRSIREFVGAVKSLIRKIF